MTESSIQLVLRLKRGTGQAVPEQVADQVRKWIVNDRLAPLEELPSLRSLARGAGAHPSLVARGLERLEREGWIESSEVGYLVGASRPLVGGRESLDTQLQGAREAQQRLLPDDLETDDIGVVSYSDALYEVSGDFYDWFSDAAGDRWTVAVGDVAGKGLAAGMVMASVQTALRMRAGRDEPGQVMTDLNVEVGERTRARDFVALTLVDIDLNERTLRACSAGAPDVLVRTASGIQTLQVPGPRLPLGLRPAVSYETRTMQLEAGDQLLVFSDGLPETPTGDGDLLGYARFEDRAKQLMHASGFGSSVLRDFVRTLDEDLGGQPSDDRTAVWIRL